MRSEQKCITGKPCSLKICVSIWSEDDTQTTLHIYSIRRENGTQNTSRPQQNSRYMPTRKLKHTSENYNSKLNTKQAMTKCALHANNWALSKKVQKNTNKHGSVHLTINHCYLLHCVMPTYESNGLLIQSKRSLKYIKPSMAAFSCLESN